METMKDLVKQVYQKCDIKSEAELARLCNISPQAMNQYNSGRSKNFGEKATYRLAELAEKDPAYVFLIREYHRARDPRVKALWRKIIEKVTNVQILFMVVALPYSIIFKVPSLYIMSNILTGRRSILGAERPIPPQLFA